MKKLAILALAGILAGCTHMSDITMLAPYPDGILLGIDKNGDGIAEKAIDYEVVKYCPGHIHLKYKEIIDYDQE